MPRHPKKTHHANATPVVAFCQGADWKPRGSTKEPRTCGACGADLVGRNHWFCPSPRGTRAYGDAAATTCRDLYAINYFWQEARRAAIRRDGNACRRCGVPVLSRRTYRDGPTALGAEVNHIEPRNGGGYGNGCHNHQDNLETLCHDCHVVTTTQQRRERKRSKSLQLAMEALDQLSLQL